MDKPDQIVWNAWYKRVENQKSFTDEGGTEVHYPLFSVACQDCFDQRDACSDCFAEQENWIETNFGAAGIDILKGDEIASTLLVKAILT